MDVNRTRNLLRAILNSHLHTLLYLISYPIVNTKGA